MQKSRFLLDDPGSGSGSGSGTAVVAGVVADVAESVVVVVAAAVDRMTWMGMIRRIVVDYNRSVGGIGRLPWWAGGALEVAPIYVEEIANLSGCSSRV